MRTIISTLRCYSFRFLLIKNTSTFKMVHLTSALSVNHSRKNQTNGSDVIFDHFS